MNADLLQKIANRAGELSALNRLELIALHFDNEDNTPHSTQWKGVTKQRLIADIIFDEFCDMEIMNNAT